MAAGEGFKTFSTGDILTAADVNGYLMQGVWVFDDAADRTAQVTSPAEGNFSYLRDTNKLYYYTGSAWAEADTSGILPSEFTAKGDLLAGTGNATFDNLAVGTNGHVLTADSSTATGLKWASAGNAGLGSNTVQTIKTNTFTTTSSSFVDVTDLSVTITPTSSSSKVLVIAQVSSAMGNGAAGHFKLVGGNSSGYVGDAASARIQAIFGGFTNFDSRSFVISHSIVYLDSPATTSATTYKIQARTAYSGSAIVNRGSEDVDNAGANRTASSITAIEVKV